MNGVDVIACALAPAGMAQFTAVDEDNVIVTASQYGGGSASVMMPFDVFDRLIDQAVAYRMEAEMAL